MRAESQDVHEASTVASDQERMASGSPHDGHGGPVLPSGRPPERRSEGSFPREVPEGAGGTPGTSLPETDGSRRIVKVSPQAEHLPRSAAMSWLAKSVDEPHLGHELLKAFPGTSILAPTLGNLGDPRSHRCRPPPERSPGELDSAL